LSEFLSFQKNTPEFVAFVPTKAANASTIAANVRAKAANSSMMAANVPAKGANASMMAANIKTKGAKIAGMAGNVSVHLLLFPKNCLFAFIILSLGFLAPCAMARFALIGEDFFATVFFFVFFL